MGIAHDEYCYATANDAVIAVNSDYSHEHNPSYAMLYATVESNLVVLRHYKISQGNLVEDTSILPYTLPTCAKPGPLNSSVEFDPSTLNPVDVFSTIAHGFILVAVPLAVIWGGRRFINLIFQR
jgi:hypothetical protein